MNTNIITLLVAFALLCKAAPATDASIDWQVIASAGGGGAKGGVYTLAGTLGEPAAHRTTVTAASAVDGGFWARWSPASFGLPVLNVEQIDIDTVRLSWTDEGGAWLLQRSIDLETWSDMAATSPADEVLAPGGAFYRLILP